MTTDPHAINDETLQYMHATPFFNLEQQRRFEYLKQVGDEITNIAKQFTIYADLGQKMCSEFKSLRRSFNNMEIICTDQSIKPLSQILKAVDTAFTSHFNIISQRIVSPLNNFVQKELEQLSNDEREYQKHFIAFNTIEEKYVSMKPLIKEKDRLDKENQLTQEHGLATLSFFSFCMRMEEIELKLKSKLPDMFLSYITSVSCPFTECISAMNDKGEELNTTKTTIEEVERQIQEFSNHSISLKQNLSAQLTVFWDRLKVPFSGTTATSIQGYLWKRKSNGMSKSFHRRFFMLSNGVLSYAKTVDEALRTTKNLSLTFCSVRPEPNAPRMNCFSITSPKKFIFLQALTQWDMNNWVAVIKNNIAQQISNNSQEKLLLKMKFEDGIGSPNNNTTDSNDSYDDYSDGLPLNFNQPVLTTICADCGCMNASWASLNFAVTLCDNCVAEHRFLSSRISKVRSLVLDEVDPYQKALAEEAIGTVKANQILEAELKPEEKISPISDNQQRRNFIIAKYEKRQFMSRSYKSEPNINTNNDQNAKNNQTQNNEHTDNDATSDSHSTHNSKVNHISRKDIYNTLIEAIKEQRLLDVYRIIMTTDILSKENKKPEKMSMANNTNIPISNSTTAGVITSSNNNINSENSDSDNEKKINIKHAESCNIYYENGNQNATHTSSNEYQNDDDEGSESSNSGNGGSVLAPSGNEEKKRKQKRKIEKPRKSVRPSTLSPIPTVKRSEHKRRKKDRSLFTIVHTATVVGNPLILSIILLNMDRKNIDPLDEGGWSPLSYAVYFSNDTIIDLLLSFGANPEVSSIGKGNVYDIARINSNKHLMAKFEDYKGKSTFYNNGSTFNMDSDDEQNGENNQPKEELKPPHTEITPQTFIFKEFVENPSQYFGVKFLEQKRMKSNDKKKLNSAIDTLRHRLSVANAHNRLLSLTSESDDDQSV